MRVLKFRIWDKENKQIHYCDAMEIMDNGIWFENSSFDTDNHNDDEAADVMQFTGLHDTNSKEIYEGDIVNLKTNYHTQSKKFGWQNVEIFYDYVSFKGRNKEGHVYDLDEETDESSYSWEVKGNRFENPELL